MNEKRDLQKGSIDVESWTWDDRSWSAQVSRDGCSAIQGDAKTREQAEALALQMLAQTRLVSSGLESLAHSIDSVVSDWTDGEGYFDPEGTIPQPSAESLKEIPELKLNADTPVRVRQGGHAGPWEPWGAVQARATVHDTLIRVARSVARWWVLQDGIGALDMEALVKAVRAYETAFRVKDDPLPREVGKLAEGPVDEPG